MDKFERALRCLAHLQLSSPREEAEEIFRELRRYPRAEDEKGHQEVPQ